MSRDFLVKYSVCEKGMAFKYKFSIWYIDCQGRPRNKESKDCLKIAEDIVKYFDRFFSVYFPDEDLLPGSNYFVEFFKVIEESEYLIFLLSPDFAVNEWHKYLQQSAFKEMIDSGKSGSDRLIPIAVANLKDEDIPHEFNIKRVISRDDYLHNLPSFYQKLRKVLEKSWNPDADNFENLSQPVQASDDDVENSPSFTCDPYPARKPVEEVSGMSETQIPSAMPTYQATQSAEILTPDSSIARPSARYNIKEGIWNALVTAGFGVQPYVYRMIRTISEVIGRRVVEFIERAFNGEER